jgi:quercetin dioxygenase-like cupin family protein
MTSKYIAREEVKFNELQPGGPKLGALTGDPTKGPYVGLLQLTAGFVSPMHSHSGDYEAVQISGTSRHWTKDESEAKAKKMTPGSYWMIAGGVDHISACEKGSDCVMLLWQKTKFDFAPGKDAKGATPATPAKPAAPAKKTP